MDFSQLMEQAQQMQASLTKIQDELAETIYEGKSQGVIVKIAGNHELVEVTLPDELMNVEDKEILQDMILIAANEAVDKAQADREEKLGAAAGGLNIPGF